MLSHDFKAFSKMLEDVAAFYPQSKPPTADQKAIYFRALREVSLDQVRAAFDAHMRDTRPQGGWMPLPSHLLAQIADAAKDDGRPLADEAWATAVRSVDEFETVVWTEETALAWVTARSVFDRGDQIGARLAFREAYNRLVDRHRENHVAVSWVVSEGFDADRRRVALERAVIAGYLPRAESDALQLSGPPAKLTDLLNNPNVPQHVRDTIERFKQRVAAKAQMPGQDAIDKARTAELQADTQQRVDEYREEGGHAV